MSESVNLPALGESVTEGTVTRWLKNVGDRVEVDEPLLEVSTDKVDTEIPSPIAGVIEAILVQEDETVEVGTALVTIGDGSGEGDAPAAAPAQVAPETPAQEAPTQAPPAAPQQAAPAAAPAPPTASDGEGYETPSVEDEVAPAAPPGDQAPGATPSSPEPSAEAVVPSTDAPRPDEAAAPHPPAPAEGIDPAPAVQAATPEDAQPAPQAPPAAPAAPAAPPTTPAPAAPAPSGGADDQAGYVTPLVRKLAHEHGVDLSTVSGTGVGGRIRKQDVLAASAPAETSAPPAPAATAKKLETSPLRGTTVPMSRLRKVVAERAVFSMQNTAQLTTVVEADVTLIAQLRDRVKADFQSKTGTKLSFLPFFALAAAEALRAYPIVNATVEGENIVYPPNENMSIAVDTERGLLTPVIRDAGALDLAGFAAQIADLAQRTRDNKLKPDELAGGTFTLTNTGSRGALFDTPVVFLPQVAILGTGIVSKKPVVVSDAGGDAIAIRSMVYLALSYDHRIVDGADAARFLTAVKERLEGGDFEGDLGI